MKMKIYRKNVNKTAESIVNKICNNGDVIIVEISKPIDIKIK